MADKTATNQLNLYQKLMKIRQEFRKETLTKSGLNTHSDFVYYELKDIVPIAERILTKYGCLFLCSTEQADGKDYARGMLVDTDSPMEKMQFHFLINHLSEPAKFRMNEIQATGAELTYYRRYLYCLMLDLTDKDEVDSDERISIEKPKPVTAPARKTPEKRAEIAAKITDADGPANEMQLNALKVFCEKLLKENPASEEFVQQIAINTKSFSECKKSVCETLVNEIAGMLTAMGGGNEVGK